MCPPECKPIELRPIGHVESPLGDRAQAPKQGDEADREVLSVHPRGDLSRPADLKPVLGSVEER